MPSRTSSALTPGRPRLRRLVLLGTLATCAAVPAAADAGTITQEGTALVYTAAPGERNSLRVLSSGRDAIELLEQTSSRITPRTPICVSSGFAPQVDRFARCSIIGISRIDVRLGDGDDSFGSGHPLPAQVDAGPGDDSFTGLGPSFQRGFGGKPEISQVTFAGGPGRDEAGYQQLVGPTGVTVTKDGQPFDGRPGDRDNILPDVEVLAGSPQGDVLAGTNGPDVFRSTGGADQLLGAAGDDLFLMGTNRDGATRVSGGADRDTVTYAERARRIRVSADDEATPDGEDGEGDQILETEVVEGSRTNDVLTAAAATELGYRLIGGPGDDLLTTGAGRDRLIGGAGRDEMHAGADRDTIEGLDGERDDAVDCGTGSDVAFRDFSEGGVAGCEGQQLPQLVGRLGLSASAPARAGGTARVAFSWAHPKGWERLRSVRLRLRDGARTVGGITVRPRDGRVVAGDGVRLEPGTKLSRRGKRVAARLEVRLPAVRTAPLSAEIVATDTAGRRQAEERSITIVGQGS